MSKRKELVIALHDRGMTYDKIGELLGITKQRAHQIATGTSGDRFQEGAVLKIRYVGLRNWMLENRVKMCDLEKRCGLSRLARSIGTDRFNPSKRTIDAILRVTGLTYEECFREEPDDEGPCSE